jgi:glycosyltransferase involved in cell wall biosynthesis
MTQLRRLAFIGNALPRRCGIATFTTDLQQATAASSPDLETCIVAMNDHGRSYDYPATVGFAVDDSNIEDYARAAAFLNAGHFQAVSLQHEFGIFGGEAGSHIMALLSRLVMPIVTTLHTIVAKPTPAQRDVLEQIVTVSTRIVVMSKKGKDLLCSVYQVPPGKIDVIAHGIPDFPFTEPDAAKAELGFSGRPVILTFGLLSPNKGIEVMIDAMPAILASVPNAVYVVLGATHPNLVREQGETYRDSLVNRVHVIGVDDHVVFLDQFVDQPTLLRFIAMCDVYVTPYLTEAQMTSGTLSYSSGLGKAVVSTPYWHAQDLLGDGRGVLVPFGDAKAMGAEIAGLLLDDDRRLVMRQRAYAGSRSMTWANTALNYLATFEQARRTKRLKVVTELEPPPPREVRPTPGLQPLHFLAMCDDTGLFQHAVHSVPDRAHGYCVDDNARALLVACALNAPGEQSLPDAVTARFASFIQHAWNPRTGRFRNFMSFSRVWLEEQGSEDSHGRALWALGECARSDSSPTRQRWAIALFGAAFAATEGFSSPRAWAFALLGLDAYCAVMPADAHAARTRLLLAERLTGLLFAAERADWIWFETGLSYDNARLSQALLVTGVTLGVAAFVEAGLRSLRWLMAVQTSPAGMFRPVGSEGFGDQLMRPKPFDQQPLEATATIAACLAAWRADGDPRWKTDGDRAFAWFLGDNDLGTPLVDPDTGSCRDGLHRDRANENRGGESAVSYLLGLLEIRQIERMNQPRVKLAPSPT